MLVSRKNLQDSRLHELSEHHTCDKILEILVTTPENCQQDDCLLIKEMIGDSLELPMRFSGYFSGVLSFPITRKSVCGRAN